MSTVKKVRKETVEADAPPQETSESFDLREQLVAIFERLEAIERKIDTTLNDLRQARQQPQGRPFNGPQGGGFRPFQPNRRPGHFQHHGGKHQGHGSYQKPYFNRGQHREHRGGYGQHSQRPSHGGGQHHADNAGNR